MNFTPDELLEGSIEDVRNRLKQIDADAADDLMENVVRIVVDPQRAEVVRAEAAMTLGRCSTEECRSRLKQFLCSEDPILRRLATAGLGEDRSESTILWLIEMLADDINKVRNVAERSLLKRLSHLGTAGIDALLETLAHSDPLTRSPAARLLGQSQNERALAPLLEMLQSDEWLERMWAAKSLGDLGKADAVEALTDRLHNDEKNRVRAASSEALGSLRPENIHELLKHAADNDEDEGVRKTAHEALLALSFEAEDSEVDPFADD